MSVAAWATIRDSVQEDELGMRSVLLHMGPHKTGTTYLQVCLAQHRALLAARGFALPVAWQHAPSNPSHTGLVAALREGGDLAAAAQVIEDAMEGGAHSLIVSAEDLVSLRPDAYARLRTLFDGWAVTVIFYVRRWSDLLPSDWQEMVKQGASTSLPEHLLAHLRNPPASRCLNFELALKPIAEVFGMKAIRLVCYSALSDSGSDLFRHFSSVFLGWNDSPVVAMSKPPNASRDIFDIEMVRVINGMEFVRTGVRSAALRNRFDMMKERLDMRLLREAMDSARRGALLDDAFPYLIRLHKRLYDQFREQIVPPSAHDMFFKPNRKEIPYISDEYLLRPGIAEAYRDLYAATST